MQSLHQQQQQLAALLAAAQPNSATSTSARPPPPPATSATPPPSDENISADAARVAALTSLHRAIIYPPNSVLITHSASFVSQSLSQLLSDKSYTVRQAAATGYGALCSVLCSISTASNGRQNHGLLGNLVDQFISWALPSLNNVGEVASELALEGLREFLSVGEVGAVERYALPILKACQELLEDERTSLNLLRKLLAVLTLISLKFFRCFQPQFVDIVDLLLGWAMAPDLKESDRRVIMDSFLQFQKHWVNNLQFSLGLLSKFLGDMDVLLQDGSPGTPNQFQRLLALLSCFSTVLQSVASGLLEMNLLEQITEPLCSMVPILLGCLSLVGRKFRWSTWIEDSWRCLTLLAEILSYNFSPFYPVALKILFQSLDLECKGQLTSFQIHGVLKTNLHLLSLQKLGLLPSYVDKILQFDAPISQMRLHPNHLVTGSSTATYVFLLQHGNSEVVEKTMMFLVEELELLKNTLHKTSDIRKEVTDCLPLKCISGVSSKCYSKDELIELIKFDLKVLLICVSLGQGSSLIGQTELDSLYINRSRQLVSLVSQKLNPFELPIQIHIELQVAVVTTLERLTTIEFLCKCSRIKKSSGDSSVGTETNKLSLEKNFSAVQDIYFENLKKYAALLVRALHHSSPLAVKTVALHWICKSCENVINADENLGVYNFCRASSSCMDVISNLLLVVLHAAFDTEPKVRFLVPSALEMLLKAKVLHPSHFPSIAEVSLEKLGDPEKDIKSAFMKLVLIIVPVTVYVYGLQDFGVMMASVPDAHRFSKHSRLHWKQLFALRALPCQLQSQQLVTILSYLSQRWKVPLSSWILRLIQTCKRSKDPDLTQLDDTTNVDPNSMLWNIKEDEDVLERICFVNLLSGAWWAVNEAARYCITTRLRTNLGGPTQTFAALERMLLDIAHVLHLDSEHIDGNVNIIGSSYAHLLPMRLLLDFVEALKKNVYNAYEGSIVLPGTPRPSSMFFRSNKKVCEEWFSRICEPMMNAGLALQCHHATIHYCSLRLNDISNHVSLALMDSSRAPGTEGFDNLSSRYAKDIMRILQHMALALCKNHEHEALKGIQIWASRAFSALLQVDSRSPTNVEVLGHFSWITGLVYQAKGQHEKAAAHFIHLLQTEESLSSMSSEGVQFAIARIIENFASVSDWKSLESWLTELQNLRAKHAGKFFSGALTTAGNEVSSIQALARFDEGDFSASWACLDLTPKSSSELTLDPKLALQRSEQMLLQAMLLKSDGKIDEASHELQRGKLMLDEILSVLPLDGIVEASPYINQLHCISTFEENIRLTGRQDQHFESLLGSYVQSVGLPSNKLYQDCNMWLKVSRVCQTTLPLAPVTLKLCNHILILARKQKNLLLASRLTRWLRDHGPSCSDENVRDSIINSLLYEDILLMHAESKHEDALMNMWSFVRPCIISPSSIDSNSSNNLLKAKACLKLSKWLIRDNLDVKLKNLVPKMVSEFEMTESSSSAEFSSDGGGTLISVRKLDLVVEELVGSTLKLSTYLCPIMGKSWIAYGSWCYDQAKLSISSSPEAALSSCSFSSVLASQIYPERFSLTIEEKLDVSNILSRFSQQYSSVEELNEEVADNNLSQTFQNKNSGKSLLQRVINIIEGATVGPGSKGSTGEHLSFSLRSELERYSISQNIAIDEATLLSIVGDFVNIWWALRKRTTSLFGHAAQAFIKYLSCSSSKCDVGKKTCWDGESKYESLGYTLRATLYILHILLNYGVELQETLEPALSAVPLLPWQEVTPQLFSRLSSHPEKVVRKQIENLLVMLAKQSPWSIVYPALVDANAYSQEPSEELQLILGCLNKLHSTLVKDVQLMIKELTNVTVLWEELWLSTLQDLHGDVLRRINLLRDEAARVTENVTLSHGEKSKINAAKYSAMMAPVIVVLERRLASTSRKPETPHEKWFLEEFGKQISLAILNFKTPPTSAAAIGDVWRPFDSIAVSLASHQRKSSVSLSEVAPQLAMLMSTDAPMPGLEKHVRLTESASGSVTAEGIVSIASIYEQVDILSTKTKPKKIIMLGSDGEKYTYLLKGREDLRLDARIMQMLQAVNGFLNSSSATRGQSLGIRHYTVTPIGGQAGLIQWVDNVTSIYTVFKSWQTRAQMAQLSTQVAGNPKNMVPPPVPRPVDMFYGKIIPALKEKGIRRVISRRDWPQDVKRKVLLDLMDEAPKELLRQELWCASEGFKAFSSKSKRYSGSVAAMSIVGHILGLGDRHLDNILIDFCTGDIIHIDYNVCFDKGQRLKVPEIVPFRLTQTLEAALGLTGIEGTFRAYCEAILGIVKKNKDIILMLLEAFVWDPLVEWTRGDFHDDAAVVGEERKGMELAVSLSLFASRVQEIRVPLQEHHDLLLTTLPTVESALEKFENVLNQYEIVSTIFYRADQERSNLALHETSTKSIVSEATSKSENILASLEMQAREFAKVQGAVTEKVQEASTWIEQHGRILDALRNQSIPDMSAGFKFSGFGESLSLVSAVLVAGVPTTIVPEPTQVQCHDIDREVSLTVAELDHGCSSAVASLETYSLALRRILPLNYLSTSPIHGWAQILQLSVSSLSSEIISLARRQAVDLVKKVQNTESDPAKRNYDNLCLNVVKYASEIDRLQEEIADLVKTTDPEYEQRAMEPQSSSFVNSLLSADFIADKDIGLLKHEGPRDSSSVGVQENNKGIVLAVLGSAASVFYDNVKHKMVNGLMCSLNHANRGNFDHVLQSDVISIFCELEEQVDKCMLVAGLLTELQDYFSGQSPNTDADSDAKASSTRNWPSIFVACLRSCKSFVQQMIEVVLPEVIRSFITSHSEVMDVFGSVSQVKGSVDPALQQLIELELERASLVELEQNYFVKVGLITEQQLGLEEAALKGRDHLSWEEAEELASQEEACRLQLEKLHHAWSQKDARTSSLLKKEASTRTSLVSLEHRLQSLIKFEYEEQRERLNGKALLALLVQPFTELESNDEVLSSYSQCLESSPVRITELAELIHAGCPISQYVWNFPRLASNHSFFIWKLSVIDLFLDSCIHNAALSVDLNLGFDQLINLVKLKTESQLQGHIGHYLKERVAPMLMSMLDREIETCSLTSDFGMDVTVDNMQEAVKRVHILLEEFCNAHETVRSARSSVSLKKRKVIELKEALLRTSSEIVQMKWMHDVSSSPLQNNRLICHKFLPSEDLLPVLLNISRPKLLEDIQSATVMIAKSLENLKVCEHSSVAAEGQLERAMSWACGGPGSSAIGSSIPHNSGIPQEFHDHLMRRRHHIQEVQDKASNILNLCISVLEFEASRDGIFHSTGEFHPLRSAPDGNNWQEVFLNMLKNLEITFHSFTCTEEEWRLAQSNVEAASSCLFSATNELRNASVKADSASDDMQNTLLAMRDCTYEVSVVLSAYEVIARGHTALTSGCGSMLEEVLAITEGLHDVHNLGKEAAALHSSLMRNLAKANAILLPLESLLSKDVAAMADAMSRDRDLQEEIAPVHGHAIFQSYNRRIKEASLALKPVVSPITSSVGGLHSILTRLARTASLHAGNLHKALEGLGESQEVRSQDTNPLRPDLIHESVEDEKESEIYMNSNEENYEDSFGMGGLSLQDKGWVTPPESIMSSGSSSDVASTETSIGDCSSVLDIVDSVTQSNNTEVKSLLDCLSSSETNLSIVDLADSGNMQENSDLKFENKIEIPGSSQDKIASHETSLFNPEGAGHRNKGKNAYAVSIMRRVEMKIDGRDIAENRDIGVSEQVDYLLKQATSVDNLCNMYEGWTPWI